MDSAHDQEDEFSSSSEVDSEFEALLYSQIHHEVREDENSIELQQVDLENSEETVAGNILTLPEITAELHKAGNVEIEKYRLFPQKELTRSSIQNNAVKKVEKMNSADQAPISSSEFPPNNSDDSMLSTDSDDDWFDMEYQKVCDESISINISSNGVNSSGMSDVTNKRMHSFPDPRAIKKLRGDRAVHDAGLKKVKEIKAAMRNFYDSDCSEFEVEDVWMHMGTSGHLWKLDFHDTSDLTSRYYSRPGRSNIMCHNCKHRGHLSRDCPDPRKPIVCFMCGMTGHTSSRCHFQMCSRCMQPGHSSQGCRVASAFKNWFCKRCSVSGHTDHLCPGLWRMYHLTTKDDGEIVKPSTSSKKPKHCSNCAKQGHFIHDCPKKQPNYYISAPIVVNSYEPKVPNLLLQKLGIKHRHPISSSTPKESKSFRKSNLVEAEESGSLHVSNKQVKKTKERSAKKGMSKEIVLPTLNKKKPKSSSSINVNWKDFQVKCVEKIKKMTTKKKEKLFVGRDHENGIACEIEANCKDRSKIHIANSEQQWNSNETTQKLSKRLKRKMRSDMKKNQTLNGSVNLTLSDNTNFKTANTDTSNGTVKKNKQRSINNNLKVNLSSNENLLGPESNCVLNSTSPKALSVKKKKAKNGWVGWRNFKEQQAYLNAMNFNNIGDKKKIKYKYLNAWFDNVQ